MASAYTQLTVGLLLVSLILIGLGGYMDIFGVATGDPHFFGLSKQHCWADGLFLLGLGTFALLWGHTRGYAQ